MPIPTYNKAPDEVLDITNDWTLQLADGDTISASTWTAPTGITVDSDSATTTEAVVWLSGGTLGQAYALLNHITTAGGRELEQSINVVIITK